VPAFPPSSPVQAHLSIAIPIYHGVDMLDVTGPFEMFRWAGIDTHLVAPAPGAYTCNGGLIIQVSEQFDGAEGFDAIWVPGGDPVALAGIINDPMRTYLDYLVRQSSRVRYVTSVCEGALLLAAAGLLDGYEATTHWAFIPCLEQLFPSVRVAKGHPRFVLDRNRLTGGGISSGLDESLKLIEILRGTASAQYVQQMTQYYPDLPVSSEIPPTQRCPLPPIRNNYSMSRPTRQKS
jgi:cyclohexyl-isocyanide hydratase